MSEPFLKTSEALPRREDIQHREKSTPKDEVIVRGSHSPSRIRGLCCTRRHPPRRSTEKICPPSLSAGKGGGVAYKKETCLWTPFDRTHLVCACKCHHFPDGPPASEGRGSHPYTIAGHSPRVLKGPGEITHRNRIPGCLLKYLLTHAKKKDGSWTSARGTRPTGEWRNCVGLSTSPLTSRNLQTRVGADRAGGQSECGRRSSPH